MPQSDTEVMRASTSRSERRESNGRRQLATVDARGIGRRAPKGEGWLIRDVHLEIHPGDRLAIFGPSGAGKTVLLRALAMLDPLDRGEIYWKGEAVRAEDVPSYRKDIILLHQRPALSEGSVGENLQYPFSLKVHRGRHFDRECIIALLEGLGRDESFLEKPTRDLSGGEAQLVALLRAIQLDPEVLLLDEPTASLDRATACAVEGLLDRWYSGRAGERSLVWISHDLEQARRVTGRRLTMQSGRLQPGR